MSTLTGADQNEDSFLQSPFLLCFHLVQGSRFRVQRRRWRLSLHIYMRRCPKAGRLHPCPLLLKTFSKIKKLFSIVKSFSILGKFVHYTEQFEHGAERRHTYAASFLLICENDAIVIVFFCLFVKLLCSLIGAEGFKRCSLRFILLNR